MLAWKFSPLLIPLAFASIGERAIRSDVRIYAYGVGIDGLPIYADSQCT